MKNSQKETRYTITHLSMLLGVSASVIRSWERKGIITSPRDSAGNRKYTIQAIAFIAQRFFQADKITKDRFLLIRNWVNLCKVLDNGQ